MWRAREVCLPGALVGQPQEVPWRRLPRLQKQGGPHPGCSEAHCFHRRGRWDRQGRPGAPRWPMGLCRPASPISLSLRPVRSLSLSPHRRWSLTDAWQPRLRHRTGLWRTRTQSSRNAQEVPPGWEVTAPSERGLTASTESQGAKTPCRPADSPRVDVPLDHCAARKSLVHRGFIPGSPDWQPSKRPPMREGMNPRGSASSHLDRKKLF